ncbi:hypothetical protein GTGU_00171 [Trabulsiella guamensis ATCC 49490]|uniref:Phage protein n=1 Tax=Trabulsiella guamensis ATCC 49490 TaxID=1005994 RepID=A0A085ASD4_9ENTR|nr:hypothetical protein [Trabulsiella guamensis]KFC13129.1 hypothetical protein GTGU_00171 [Trabulsiella guamensis ATCC 49490]
MSRFRDRLMNADARINRAFAEDSPAVLFLESGPRQVTVIYESPDAPVEVPGTGKIVNQTPAFSAMTADLTGLAEGDKVDISGASYRVTHIGSDEYGRTRVTLGRGEPGNNTPEVLAPSRPQWRT